MKTVFRVILMVLLILFVGVNSLLAQLINPNNEHAYQLINEKMTWQEAKSSAESLTPPVGFLIGHLVTYSDSLEEKFIIDSLGNNLNGAWIGFTDESVEGEWHWVDDTPGIWQDPDNFINPIQTAYTNWRYSTNEPNNEFGREDYAVYSTFNAPSPQWNDLPNNVGGYDSYLVEFEPDTSVTTFQLTVSVDDGWNMVSVPGLHPVDQDVNTWWSGLTGDVFKFSGSYQVVTAATPTEGYWMKNAGAQTYNYPAIEIVTHDPIPALTGWNMIGGYENSAAVSGLTTTPPGLISGSVFGYSGGYNPATNLVPGYGYWIKLTGDGVINIPGGPLSKGSTEVVEYFKDDWGRIIITDNAGRSYTLYAVNGEVDLPTGQAGLNNYELPPMPPAGMFDIRYGSGRIAEDISSSIQSIEMSGIEYPVRVRVENMSITLQDESGKNINTQLNPGEEITINNNSINKLMVLSGGIVAPTEYALEQNYPNPFNPSTTINFAVPKESSVNLSIYNVLGELVSTIVNEEMIPGYYEYKFDASNLASGVYLYRISAGDFIDVKKMILMK